MASGVPDIPDKRLFDILLFICFNSVTLSLFDTIYMPHQEANADTRLNLAPSDAPVISLLQSVLAFRKVPKNDPAFRSAAQELIRQISGMIPEQLELAQRVRTGLPPDPSLEGSIEQLTNVRAPAEAIILRRLLATDPDRLLKYIAYLNDRRRIDAVKNSPELSQLVEYFRERVRGLNLKRVGRKPAIQPDGEAWGKECERMEMARLAVEDSPAWKTRPRGQELALEALRADATYDSGAIWLILMSMSKPGSRNSFLAKAPYIEMIDPDRVEACVRGAPLTILEPLLVAQRASTAVELGSFDRQGFTISFPLADQERREFRIPGNCLV